MSVSLQNEMVILSLMALAERVSMSPKPCEMKSSPAAGPSVGHDISSPKSGNQTRKITDVEQMRNILSVLEHIVSVGAYCQC